MKKLVEKINEKREKAKEKICENSKVIFTSNPNDVKETSSSKVSEPSVVPGTVSNDVKEISGLSHLLHKKY